MGNSPAMTLFVKLFEILQFQTIEPQPFKAFHWACIILAFICVGICCSVKLRNSEKQLKIILAAYAVPTLILEMLKQISWSASIQNGVFVWDYQWYIFPFQLCTTPLIVAMVCLFLKKNWLRTSLFAYISFITILGSIAVMLVPSDAFVTDVLVNIHTTYLHFGSFVLSIYLVVSGNIELNAKSLIKGIVVFVFFACIAMSLNEIIYQSGILNGETFNMFFLSPYFDCTLPVFNVIQKHVPHWLFSLSYVVALSLGGTIVYFIEKKLIKVDIQHSLEKHLSLAKSKK